MHTYRPKVIVRVTVSFIAVLLLAASVLTAAAQSFRRPSIGNELIARQRSTRFLAERGIALPSGARTRFTLSPAQLLSRARGFYRSQVAANSTSSLSTATWQPVGPAQVVTAAYGDVTGRVTSIAVDPSDSSGNTVYVGTSFGGVWKSTNAAGIASSATFVPITDSVYSSFSGYSRAPSLSIGAVSVQPVTAGTAPVILAGTGVANDTTASYFGAGILRSTDGGNTWTLLTHSNDLSNGGNTNFGFMGNGFSGFAWGNVSSNPVVVAAVSQSESGVETYADEGQNSVMGIYYSTDLGQTWYMATIADPGGLVQSPQTIFTPCAVSGSRMPCGNAVTSIVWNPIRKEFFAALRFHGYYQSSDGQNWTRITNQPGVNLTTSMCPPNTGYSGSQACPIYNGALAVQPVTGDTFALTTDISNLDQGLWQDSCSLASGSCASSTLTFAQISDSALDVGALIDPSQPTLIPQADYDLYLAAVPTVLNSQPDTLLFAGTADIYRCDLGAGCTWRNTTHAQSSDCNSAHVAPAQYAIDATFGAGGLLYFGNDGGLWRSTDDVDEQGQECSSTDASHFQDLNPAFTGSIAEVEDMAPDPSSPQTMMVSLGSLGTAVPLSGSTAWQQVLNGEGDYAAIDPANPQNWYATSEFGIGINQCTQGSSCSIAGFGLPVIDSADAGNDGYGQIIPAPWILDPQNTSNLILGTCRVWRGPASGGAMTQLSGMLDGDNGPYCDGNAEIRSLAATGKSTDASGTPEEIYAGMAGLYDGGATVAGHVFEQSVSSSSSSSSWIDLSNNLNNFNIYGYGISSIYVDPHSTGGQTIYVTLQGFNSALVYRSTDGGSIWQNISSDLVNAPANSIIVDPNDANVVYVATDAGVYYTQDVGSCAQVSSNCWSAFGASLPNVPVTQLLTEQTGNGPVLFAATFGRGVWQIGLSSITTTTATITPSSLTFGNQPVGTTSASQQLLVTNTGSVPLQISSLAITGDFTESDTCSGQSIAPGNTCVIEVSFTPTAIGADTGLLTVYANLSNGGQLSVPLNGTGTQGAAVTLTPVSLCFAPTLIGQTTSQSCQSTGTPTQGGQTIQPGQSIVIANTGGSTVTITSVTLSGDFAFVANTCGTSLTAANTTGDSCTVSITFTPTTSGTSTGALTVVDSAGTQTAQLAGTGMTPATDLLAPASLTFASQTLGTQSASQQVTLTNNGDESVQSITVQSSTTDFVAVNDCGTTLAGHSSCAILVSFLPGIIGTDTGTLTVSDVVTAGSTHTQQVVLTGTGIAPVGVASASPSFVNFGYYAVGGTSPAQSVTLTNNGSTSITNILTSIAGDFAVQATSTNPCGTSLSAGASCNLGIVFSPTQVNQRTGSLTITGTGLGSPLVVALTGSGAGFTIKITGSTSQVITGSQTASPFPVEIDSVNGSTGPVALTCSVVPATASCSVSPTTVTLTGNSSQQAALTFSVGQTAQAAPSFWKTSGMALALLLPIGFLARRRSRWSLLAFCAVLILLIPVGCGVSSSSGSLPSSGGSTSSAGQYTITVTGSMPGIKQSTTAQVTVQ
ncbi:MAG TPA: choice-of-anchor D domain-containing protein [Acidobacteriaceae bacterium]|nr:choice-of-anchor D domain-containing protein [Acidobacteriaceae bacterium]